ncbi:uncharacterized mitochondrial protein AtMg00810-like [Malus domestica]|uniref:uncharacterized mitochondrial protein AtMg00810-like n=1 Tax=Malus domestica TaxID=3750 RepID=UPI003975D1B0
MDVKNAFLHGDLEEKVYMRLPPEHPQENEPNMVCKLHKAIYGLRKPPCAWYSKLSSVLEAAGFKRSHVASSLFVRIGSADLGVLKYFLGIEMATSNKGLFLNQRKYVLDLLDEAKMMDSKPTRTPLVSKLKLDVEGEPLTDLSTYQRLVGKLIYLTITRPDIAYAVSLISQFMHSPTSIHWEMVKILHMYLKGSVGKGILMKKNGSTQIMGYIDAEWPGNALDRRSTTGFCTFVGGNFVTWKSKKQAVIARSSAEVEYRAMASTVYELTWLKSLVTHAHCIESSVSRQNKTH